MKDQTLQAASGCKLDSMTSARIISNFLLGHLVSASNDSPKSGSHTHTDTHTLADMKSQQRGGVGPN